MTQADPDLGRVRKFLTTPGEEPPAGVPEFSDQLGRYVLKRVIGRGGMGVVYEAEDPKLKRRVALKVLKEVEENSRLVARLHREASIAAQLQHPNIVGIHEVSMVRGASGRAIHFIAMDFVEGVTLADVLGDRHTPLVGLLMMLEETARAVGYAHSKGIVHRDLKPANILVEKGGRVLLTDFGLARADTIHTQLTRSNAVMGTPQYMAPEQVAGRVRDIDARTDVYALGVILYEALTGKVPFASEIPAELFQKILNEEPTRPSRLGPAGRQVDRDLELVCLKAMEKDPARRYRDGLEFAEDISRFRRGEPIHARPPSVFYRIRKGLRKRKTVFAVAVALVLVAGAWAGHAALERAAADRRRAEEREALNLLESGRPALLRKNADYDAFEAKVKAGQRLIEEAVAKAPTLPLGHYLLGQAWAARGDEDRAEACWRRAIGLDPRFGPARFALGRLLLGRAYLATITTAASPMEESRERFRRAEVQAEEAAAEIEAAMACPNSFDDDLQREIAGAMLAYTKQDWNRVRELAGAAIERFRKQEGIGEMHWLLGLSTDVRGDSLKAFSRAIEADPTLAYAFMSRGFEYSRVESWREAKDDYTNALKINPHLGPAFINRGQARWGLRENFEDVIADFERALELDPKLAGAWSGRGAARLAQGDLKGAIADCSEAIRLKPTLSDAFLARAQARRDSDDLDGALEDLSETLRLNPRRPLAYSQRGNILLSRRDYDGAIRDYTEATRLTPDRPAPWANLAEARFRKGQFEEALGDLDKALELAPAGWPRRAESEQRRDDLRRRLQIH